MFGIPHASLYNAKFNSLISFFAAKIVVACNWFVCLQLWGVAFLVYILHSFLLQPLLTTVIQRFNCLKL